MKERLDIIGTIILFTAAGSTVGSLIGHAIIELIDTIMGAV